MSAVIELVEPTGNVSSPAPRAARMGGATAGAGILALAAVTTYVTVFVTGTYAYLYNVTLLAAMGAIALNLLMGTAGQMSLGNAAFLAVGAYVAVAAREAGLPVWLGICLAVVAAAAVGALAAMPALRLRGLYMALATLSVHFIVLYAADSYQRSKVGVSGFVSTPYFTERGLNGGQRAWSWTLFVILSLLVIAAARLMRGRTGRAWRMIRDNEEAAPILGIPVLRYKLLVFVLSSAVIGLQGALTVFFTGTVTVENFTIALAIQYLAMVIIGGLDSILGAVIGAAFVSVLPTLVPELLEHVTGEGMRQDGPAIAQIVYGLLLAYFVVAARDGIAGLLRRLRRRADVGRRWRTTEVV